MQSGLAFMVIIKGVITLRKGPTTHERAQRISPEMVSCALISVTSRRVLWFRVPVWWEPWVWQTLPCHFDLRLGFGYANDSSLPRNWKLQGFHLKGKYDKTDPFFPGHCLKYWTLLWSFEKIPPKKSTQFSLALPSYHSHMKLFNPTKLGDIKLKLRTKTPSNV